MNVYLFGGNACNRKYSARIESEKNEANTKLTEPKASELLIMRVM